jgi:small-conductance mechanosensitive channel
MSPQSWIEHLTTTLLNYLPHLISAGVILLFSFVGAIIVRKVVGRLLFRADPAAQRFACQVAYVAALIGGGLLALAVSGLHIAALATLIGALGLAVSLSLQDVAKNFVAGLYLVIERPFKRGDRITVRSFSGQVEVIDLRTTTLRTDEGHQVILPNTIIMSEIILKQLDKEPRA